MSLARGSIELEDVELSPEAVSKLLPASAPFHVGRCTIKTVSIR